MSLVDTSATGYGRPAVGKPTGFWENLEQGYEQQYRVDSPYSLAAEVEQRWLRSIERYEQLTGESLDKHTSLGTYNTYARYLSGETSWVDRGVFTGELSPDAKQAVEQMDSINTKLKETGNEEVKSFEQILEEVFQLQAEVEQQSNLYAETGGVAGAIGQFIGATAGAFNPQRDPLTFFTLGLGGIGRSAFQRVLSEAAIAGTVTAATEFGAVQPNRELAGLPERNGMFDVAAAAAGAGVFAGGGELIGALLRRRRVRQAERADADFRENARAVAEELGTPNARGALHLLDQEDLIRNNSPYGTSREGLQRFAAEVQELQFTLNSPEPRISPAIPALPFEQVQRAADFELVRSEAPEIYGELEASQQRLAEINTRLGEVQQGIDDTTFTDAVRLVDEGVADQVDAIAQRLEELDEGSPEARALEVEAEALVNRVGGVERIARVLEDAEIAPRQEIKRLRQQRKAEQKRYRRAFNRVEAERQRLQQEIDSFELEQNEELVNLIDASVRGTGAPPVQMQTVSEGMAESVAKRLEAVDEEADEYARGLVEGFDEEGADLGLLEDIDPEMRFLDIDDEGNVRESSVRQVMQELRDDIALEEATRSCSV